MDLIGYMVVVGRLVHRAGDEDRRGGRPARGRPPRPPPPPPTAAAAAAAAASVPPPATILSVATIASHVGYGSDVVRLSWLSRTTWADVDLAAALESPAPRPPVDAVRLTLTASASGGDVISLVGWHLHGIPVATMDSGGVGASAIGAPGGSVAGGGAGTGRPRRISPGALDTSVDGVVLVPDGAGDEFNGLDTLHGVVAGRLALDLVAPASVDAELAPGGAASAWRITRYGLQGSDEYDVDPAAWTLAGRLAGTDTWVTLHEVGADADAADAADADAADDADAPPQPPVRFASWGWRWFNVPGPPAGAVPYPRLVFAAGRGLVHRVAQLIAAGADVNASDVDCDTPPLLAACAGAGTDPAAAAAIASALIAAGADVDARDMYGDTPLLVATLFNAVPLIRQLLAAGADAGAANGGGFTPLHHAAAADAVDSARILVAAGADTSAQNVEGLIPATLALLHGAHRVAHTLVAAGGVAPSIRLAAAAGAVGMVAVLLSVGADTSLPGAPQPEALMVAASRAAVGTVRMLLAAGADVAARDRNGDTALHWTGLMDAPAAVQALVAAGAPLEARNGDGNTPLVNAVYRNAVRVARALAAAGADISAATGAGLATLCGAAAHNAVDLLLLLLAAGADVESVNRGTGRTALAVSASEADSLDAARALVRAGGRLGVVDRDGMTPLGLAVQIAPLSVVKTLLAAGADPRQEIGEMSWTPLHLAATVGGGEAAALLAAGADPDAWSLVAATPLMMATEAGAVGNVLLLLAAGADPAARDVNGRSVAGRAAEGGRAVEGALAAAGPAEPPLRRRR
jgi:ankyrin repeat protein